MNECIDLNQALRMYTYNGALALGQESYKGSLRQGKIGDLTILSENLMEVEPRQISDVQVKATLVDGEFVYQGTDF